MNELDSLESDSFYLNLVTVEFTEHFKERVYERVEEDRISTFLVKMTDFLNQLAEKIFLKVNSEFQVFCKLINRVIVVKWDAIKKHLTFITVLPLSSKGAIKKANNFPNQKLISV